MAAVPETPPFQSIPAPGHGNPRHHLDSDAVSPSKRKTLEFRLDRLVGMRQHKDGLRLTYQSPVRAHTHTCRGVPKVGDATPPRSTSGPARAARPMTFSDGQRVYSTPAANLERTVCGPGSGDRGSAKSGSLGSSLPWTHGEPMVATKRNTIQTLPSMMGS